MTSYRCRFRSCLCAFFVSNTDKEFLFLRFNVSKQFHTHIHYIVGPLLQDRRFAFLVQWRLCFGHRRRPTQYSFIYYSSVSVYQNNMYIAFFSFFFFLHTPKTLDTGDEAIVRNTDRERKRQKKNKLVFFVFVQGCNVPRK